MGEQGRVGTEGRLGSKKNAGLMIGSASWNPFVDSTWIYTKVFNPQP